MMHLIVRILRIAQSQDCISFLLGRSAGLSVVAQEERHHPDSCRCHHNNRSGS
jgi:hypothetical protein